MDQDKIANLIKTIRKDNHLTQQQLADKYHVTYQAVSKWETGKSLPDMALLKKMSKDFNISLDDFVDGVYQKRKDRKSIILILIGIVIVLIGIIIVIKLNHNDFFFSPLKSTCDNFTINGSIAYNKNKSSIYISNIDYCGDDDKYEYQKIICTLNERNNGTINVIDNYVYEENTLKTLDEFLKEVTFKIDNYSQMCTNYQQDSLYLDIEATDSNNKVTKYHIPLKIEEDCH